MMDLLFILKLLYGFFCRKVSWASVKEQAYDIGEEAAFALLDIAWKSVAWGLSALMLIVVIDWLIS